jgi:hypothetical protein
MPGVACRNVGGAVFWRPTAQGDSMDRRWLLSLFLLPALALLKPLGRRDTPVRRRSHVRPRVAPLHDTPRRGSATRASVKSERPGSEAPLSSAEAKV